MPILPPLITETNGMTTEEELFQLVQLANQVTYPKCIVEIGTHQGRSAIALAYGTKTKVYTIDPHEEFTGPCGGRFKSEDRSRFYKSLARCPDSIMNRIVYIGLTSRQAARGFWSGAVGMLFIDGDHNRAEQDLLNWEHALVPGAIVAFHDTNYGQVQEAIDSGVHDGVLVPVGKVGILSWLEYKRN